MVSIIAGIITFIFTALLTIAGVGAAFILIPVFISLGVDIHIAMSTALLLNTISMAFASHRFIQKKLVMWRVALPILITATAFSPFGAYISTGLDRRILLWIFVIFLLFASGSMFWYKPTQRSADISKSNQMMSGVLAGISAGFLGGLLGVGGGNFIIPVLVWMGYHPKKASATTSFIVIFSSFSGFLGHATIGNINIQLLSLAAIGSVSGAVVGSWLMTEKLKRDQVKIVIGFVLIGVAAKMIWDLLV